MNRPFIAVSVFYSNVKQKDKQTRLHWHLTLQYINKLFYWRIVTPQIKSAQRSQWKRQGKRGKEDMNLM